MAKPRKTAEQACADYAVVALAIRAESKQISPWNCERAAESEFRPGWCGPTTPIEPCISQLFAKPVLGTHGAYEEHRDWQEEFEGEMCEACKETLKHVRARKLLRPKLGAAKRAVLAIGKRLNAEAVHAREM